MADYVKLPTSYHLDPRVLKGDDEAEVMLNRGRAYCGAAESHGFIPDEALPMLGRRRQRQTAEKLVQLGLWRRVEDGYEHVDWDDEQEALEELLERRRSNDRTRAARYRANKRASRDTSRDPSRDASRDENVTVTQSYALAREEQNTSTAAAVPANPLDAIVPVSELPSPVLVLKSRMDRLTALSTIRWDRMTLAQVGDLMDLIESRGDAALVDAAVATTNAERRPATVQAYLGTWRTLPPRGRLVAAVEEPCDVHPGMRRPCIGCAADEKAVTA